MIKKRTAVCTSGRTETFSVPVQYAPHLKSEELKALYSSLNIIQVNTSTKMGWVGQVARTGDRRGTYRVLMGRLVATRPLGGPRHRWEDNITMDLQEMGKGGMDWIDLVQDRDR